MVLKILEFAKFTEITVKIDFADIVARWKSLDDFDKDCSDRFVGLC
jgi:hypothetical protein